MKGTRDKRQGTRRKEQGAGNFQKVIDKAITACESAGEKLSDHFVEFNRMVELGSGAQREVEDIALTRYACYLVVQNGDPSERHKEQGIGMPYLQHANE